MAEVRDSGGWGSLEGGGWGASKASKSRCVVPVYSRDNEAEARQAKMFTTEEARRIAANIARLPELLRGRMSDSRAERRRVLTMGPRIGEVAMMGAERVRRYLAGQARSGAGCEETA
jgi:hypothetical protein